MYSLLLRFKRKIKRLLKVQSASRQRTAVTRKSRLMKFSLLAVVSILVGVLYPGESLFDPLDMPRKGDIALEDVIAEFQIPVYKTERELRDERETARNAVPFVLEADTLVYRQVVRDINGFFTLADSLRTAAVGASPDSVQKAFRVISTRYPTLSAAAISETLARSNLRKIRERLTEIYRTEIYQIGILTERDTIPEGRSKNVLVRRGDIERIYPRDRIKYFVQAAGRLLTVLTELDTRDTLDVEYNFLVGRSFLRHDLTLNMPEYNRRINAELAAISEIKEIVNKGDIIVRSGARVTERQQRILQEMVRLERQRATGEGFVSRFGPLIARVVLVFGCFVLLYLFLYFFRRETYNSNPKLLALFMVFAIQLVLVHLAANQWELSVYLYPIAMLPIMVTILFDAEIGVLSVIVLALLLGIMNRFNFPLVMMTAIVGTVASFVSRQVRRRSDFFRIMLVVAFTYALYIIVIETIKLSSRAELFTEVGFGVVNGLFCGILALGILPFIESLFGFTTDITLLELSDLNHPLLKRLAIEAPGTFHHSLQVGNLSEAAAKEIGGNPLLSRVGAYYHDIGKIEVPEYFVENQLGTKSKHEVLTPTMSSMILSSHVKKGRRLGEESDIPDEVLNFIEEHHGTMVQSYFYNKAKENAGEEPPNPDDYRYPGPKPQIRETGIAMLADAVEAASRTLDDPKPARIHNLIQRIIDDRFKSGELDECPLTLRDLAKIRQAFAKVLIGAFHHRVTYPKAAGGGDDD